MTEQIVVRLAKPEDVDVLVDFNRCMAMETEEKELNIETLTAGVKAIFEDSSRGFYLVAECSGVVVGSLMITTEWSDWRNGDFWWIQSVYVRPENRKQGVFSALHKEARGRAMKTPNVCGVRLYVERENASAQEVYTRRGMKETDYKLFEEEF